MKMTCRMAIPIVLVCLLLMAVGFAIPKPDELKSRVLDKPLSDKEHYNGEHNTDYDHEAFLGEQEARTFEELTPEESRERLGKIVDRMDSDSDGAITLDELKSWIQMTQRRYVVEDVERQWKAHNPKDDTMLTWDEYKKSSYGFVDDSPENDLVEEDGFSYRDMIKRDQRRWAAADRDADNTLTKEEFTDFLHPEEAANMRDVVVLETMEDIDKNKDGQISLEEYIGDMYRGSPGEEEPDWVKSEREQFGQFRDKNGDGFMDKDEVRSWIIPPDYDHAEAEAKHLIFEADKDKDRKLTKDEILNKYDLFVGSQATDFGEALTRHDEF